MGEAARGEPVAFRQDSLNEVKDAVKHCRQMTAVVALYFKNNLSMESACVKTCGFVSEIAAELKLIKPAAVQLQGAGHS